MECSKRVDRVWSLVKSNDSSLQPKMTSTWLESGGGPFILLECEHLRYWKGINPPTGGHGSDVRFRWSGNPDALATDYDRACGIDDSIDLVEVGPGRALVLGDEPLATPWWSLGPTGGILVRWRYAPDASAAVQALAQIPEAVWEPDHLVLSVGHGPLYLFDAACRGAEIDEYLVVELGPGQYTIATGVYEPDAIHCTRAPPVFARIWIDRASTIQYR